MMLKHLVIFLLINFFISEYLKSQSNILAQEKIYKVAEKKAIPIFDNCENQLNFRDKIKCSDKELLIYIYNNINWQTDLNNEIEYKYFFEFIVEKDGCVYEIETLKGNKLMEPQFEKLITELSWIPANHKGQDIRFLIKIPVRVKPE